MLKFNSKIKRKIGNGKFNVEKRKIIVKRIVKKLVDSKDELNIDLSFFDSFSFTEIKLKFEFKIKYIIRNLKINVEKGKVILL